VIFVTHDVDEAVFLADRVIVFSARPARVLRDVRVSAELPAERTKRQQRCCPSSRAKRYLNAMDEIPHMGPLLPSVCSGRNHSWTEGAKWVLPKCIIFGQESRKREMDVAIMANSHQ
jgi:hypothetical protein